MNRLITIILVVVIASVGLMLGCTKGEIELKIGATASLTGKLVNISKSIQNGVELAAEEINKKGGIEGKKIRLVWEDEGDNPQKAVSAIQKLINIHYVPVIIGPISSSSVMAVAPIANRAKVVVLSPGATSPNITYAGEFVFRNRAAGTLEAREMAKYAYDKLGLRNIIVFETNEDYGSGFGSVFKTTFEKMGGKIVLIEKYTQGDTEFRTQLSKFRIYKFDGIYVIGVPNEVGNILKQVRELEIKTTFLMNNMENPELIITAGNAAEGIFFPAPFFDPNSDKENVKHFVESYRHRYGDTPDLFAANGYDAVYIIKYAIRKRGYDGYQIKKALYSIKDFPTVSSERISFDENGDIIQPLVIKTVKNGEFVIVSQ